MKTRGFSLVELIISLVVIVIVIGTSMTMLANISRATVMSDVLNRCTFLAERELERVNQRRFSTILNEGPTQYMMPGYTDYSYQIQTAVPPADLGLGNNMTRAKQIIVTVRHPVYGQAVLTTLVSNN